jgi:glycine/D-amino acid oxidase-like deaminating enzyme
VKRLSSRISEAVLTSRRNNNGLLRRRSKNLEGLQLSFGSDRIIARQACFRPVTQDGLPLIGKVPSVQGAYVATGHNVWGILNAPATGEALAELIADGVARSTFRPDAPRRYWAQVDQRASTLAGPTRSSYL